MARSRRLWSCALGLALLAMPMAAGDASFHRVVDGLSERYHAKPIRGLGFMSAMAGWFAPSGVHRLRMAVIDEAPSEAPMGDLEDFLRNKLDASYAPLLCVDAPSRGAHTRVYVREAGKQFDLLMVCSEAREAVVIGMRLDPEVMIQWIENPQRMAHGARKNGS